MTPAAEVPTATKRTRAGDKASQKVKKPKPAEKKIIEAIKDGLVGEGFCRRLDFEEVPPREGGQPTSPQAYLARDV